MECTYSSEYPETFLPYTLCCTGEWWYYDRGVVLNGVHGVKSCLVNYELHPRHDDHNSAAAAAGLGEAVAGGCAEGGQSRSPLEYLSAEKVNRTVTDEIRETNGGDGPVLHEKPFGSRFTVPF